MTPTRQPFFRKSVLILCLSAAAVILFLGIFLDGSSMSDLTYAVFHIRSDNDTFMETRTFTTRKSNFIGRLGPSPNDRIWTLVPGRRLRLKSAYSDLSDSWRVRLTAHKHCQERGRVQCNFYSNFVSNYSSTDGTFDLINTPSDGDCGKNVYEAYFLYCPLPPVPNRLALYRPTHIMITATDHRNAAVQNSFPLSIHYVPKFKMQLAVCVSPVFAWTDVYRLVLFLEYYISQGADYFVIYSRTGNAFVASLLGNYVQLGLIELVQWPAMPSAENGTDDPEAGLHYNGQILSMNDCLWRLRTRATYAALLDLDEFILPMTSQTVLDLLLATDKPSIGGFMFVSSYVYAKLPWINPSKINVWTDAFDFSNLPVFRDERVFQPTVRSKMIVKPVAVDKQTVHQVWKYRQSYERYTVGASTALLYHLRSSPDQLPPYELPPMINDSIFSDKMQELFNFNTTADSPVLIWNM